MADSKALIAVAIVLSLVAILIAGGYVGAPQAAVTAPTGATIVTAAGVACPSDLKTKVAVFGVSSILTTSGEEVAVNATTANVYKTGQTNAYDAITMLSSGYQTSTSGKEMVCGTDKFSVIAGKAGASGYYWVSSAETLATGPSTDLKFTLDKVGSVTAKVYVSGVVPTTTYNISTSAGATNTDGMLKISEATGGVYKNPTVFVDYNTSAFESVEIIGGTLAAIPTRLSGYEKAYTLAKGDLANYATFDGIVVKAVLRSGMAANETVTFLIADEGNFVSNGKVVIGYQDLSNNDVMGADSSTVTLRYNI